jgi:hypothetical protein
MRSKLPNKLTSELLGQSGHALLFNELPIRADSVDKVFCGPRIVRLSERSRTHSKGNQ